MDYNNKNTLSTLSKFFFKVTILLYLILLFNGCARSDVGSIDMRRTLAIPPFIVDEADFDPKKAGVGLNTLNGVKKEVLSLEYKNFSLGKKSQVRINDSLSINLRTAFINDFWEFGINPMRRFQANGEIAIVANAFEIGDGQEMDFVNMQSGRLVFFSDDVSKGQTLNQLNLPIYGPKTYTGQPFGLRLTIFELDGGNEEAKTLLN